MTKRPYGFPNSHIGTVPVLFFSMFPKWISGLSPCVAPKISTSHYAKPPGHGHTNAAGRFGDHSTLLQGVIDPIDAVSLEV